MPYACTVHPDTAAVALFTTLADGESINLCGDCVHPFAAQLAADTAPAAPAQDLEPAAEPTPDRESCEVCGTMTGDHDRAAHGLSPIEQGPATEPDPDGDEDDDEPRGFAASTIARALAEPCEVCKGRDGQHVAWCAIGRDQDGDQAATDRAEAANTA